MNVILQCLFHISEEFNLPFKNKDYEGELRRDLGKTLLAKAYSRLLRRAIIGGEQENQIDLGFDPNPRYSEGSNLKKPSLGLTIPTADFRKYLIRRVETFNNFE